MPERGGTAYLSEIELDAYRHSKRPALWLRFFGPSKADIRAATIRAAVKRCRENDLRLIDLPFALTFDEVAEIKREWDLLAMREHLATGRAHASEERAWLLTRMG